MKKIGLLFLSLLLALGLLTACGTDADSNQAHESDHDNGEQEQQEPEQQSGDTAQGSFPITITDALDEEVTIDEKPERIVSLIPSNTEIAFALGLNEEVVGVSDFDNYPEEVNEIEKIGGQEFNVEKIISLEPDLVLAHGSSAHNSKEGLDQLRNADISVVVINNAASFEDAYGSVQMVGTITGTTEEAEEIVSNMKAKLAEIEEKAASITEEEQLKVFVEVSPAPEIYTTGKGTFMHEMLEKINAKNVAGDQEGWTKLTEESIVKMNPDVIVTTYGYYTENAAEQVLNRNGWGDIPAIQNERVYDVHSDLVTRPGPRLIEGVEELASVIYPEVFKE
jgi:iron complex transport system substrate-binding protein